MKKVLYLGIVLILVSCGSNEVESTTTNVNMDGRQVSTIQIGNLEVMTGSLGKMPWNEAKKACENLGDGWRLPTKDELKESTIIVIVTCLILAAFTYLIDMGITQIFKGLF